MVSGNLVHFIVLTSGLYLIKAKKIEQVSPPPPPQWKNNFICQWVGPGYNFTVCPSINAASGTQLNPDSFPSPREEVKYFIPSSWSSAFSSKQLA